MSVDVLVIAAITTMLSVYLALSARLDMTTVPWYTMLMQPSYFGGPGFLRRLLLLLLVWVASMAFLAVGVFVVLRLSEPLVSSVLEWIGYTKHSGQPGLFTLIFIDVCVLIVIARRTHQLVRSHKELHKELYTDLFSRTDRPWWKTPLTICLDALPRLLASVYTTFYDMTGVILRGCTLLIYDQFGQATINAFYTYSKKADASFITFPGFDKAVQSAKSPRDRAYVIVCGLVRQYGYYQTKWHLNQYLMLRYKELGKANARARPLTTFAYLSNIYAAIGSVLDLYPSTDYRGLFNGTTATRLAQSWQQIGFQLQALTDHLRTDSGQHVIYLDIPTRSETAETRSKQQVASDDKFSKDALERAAKACEVIPLKEKRWAA
jgi:hypothetical protein